jgi:hypothetical protein
MSLNFVHPRHTDQVGAARITLAPVDPRVIIRASRACCCTAKPSVIVIMPSTSARPHQTDLLLCWHHYRAGRHSLAAAGATALGADGNPVADVDWPVASLA